MGDASITVHMPDGTTPTCSSTARDVDGNQTGSGSGPCSIQTSTAGIPLFNEQWVTAAIEIPATYTCTTGCRWNAEIDLNVPHDRTTWWARLIG